MFATVAILVSAVPAQLLTTDAGVVSPALVIAKERVEWSSREFADELRSTTALTWSPERRFQFDLAVPVLSRSVDVPVGGGIVRGTQEGLGDVELGVKWGIVRDDDVMRSDRFSLLGNAVFPTGDDDTRVDGVDLGPRAGLGLGTFGGALGVGYTLVRDRHRAAVALRGWSWLEDDGFDPGDAVTLDVAYWFRLSPAHFAPGSSDVEWRGVFELLGRWQADDSLNGVDRSNGGHAWSVLAGLQANVSTSISCEFGVAVPIDDTTSSTFGDLRHTLVFAFRMFF